MSAYVREVLQEITATIAAQLAACTEPWERPWSGCNTLPRNILSGKAYSGSNRLALWAVRKERGYVSSKWGTLKQWSMRRARVRRGEKAARALMPIVRRQQAGRGGGSLLDGFRVFHLFNGDQVNGYMEDHPDLFAVPGSDRPGLEVLLRGLPGKVIHGGERACYSVSLDEIRMPPRTDFRATPIADANHGYYSTLLHEYCHWTGHPGRLGRTFGRDFGDEEYAFEELVAELGSAFLLAEVDEVLVPCADHAAYIKSWLRKLGDDETYLVRAAGEAQKASDHLKQYLPKN